MQIIQNSRLYPFASKRYVKYATRGMCATSCALAAEAGVDMLKAGGNAFDAAIAAAACLVVMEPQTNGAGSDAFAIFCKNDGKMQGMNSSGAMGSGFSLQKMLDDGFCEMPQFGAKPVSVPGAPAAWAAINREYGRLPLEKVMEPAIRYAREGHAINTITCDAIEKFVGKLADAGEKGEEFDEWFKTFVPNGKLPHPGQLFINAPLANTLETIAKTGAKDYYHGEIAEKIAETTQKYGGYIHKSDMAAHEVQWVAPLKADYHGYEIWELPPNGQGIIALMALNILDGFEPATFGCARDIHRQIEAIKLAFSDGLKYIADPKSMNITPEEMLSAEYAAKRRALIGETAIEPYAGDPKNPGTVYLCAADNEGNMISYIQSNYAGFGSGVVVPGTGIALQNRAKGFNLERGHANCAEAGKKPYHTIIPAFLTKNSKPIGPFGVMGGFMQPQAHVQVMANYIDCGLNPQACIDAPRWQWTKGKNISVEAAFPAHIYEELAMRGHKIAYDGNTGMYGKGQMIFNTPDATLIGATEPRCEGACATW